ncbi:hypothetical protein RND71_013519 [Anisodus tanguticus]|uniref:Uncharacterized protein n=1 Tax=Anisodus tanguticus TaxID=243964 RepID=A0AAE1S7A5_9SOLA|nr:hypothetical protein RND71_013519 [Anisodus tanguticus]
MLMIRKLRRRLKPRRNGHVSTVVVGLLDAYALCGGFCYFHTNAMPASFPQYVTEAINGPVADPPGVKLRNEGLKAKHPVVFVPGIVTCGLELWEGHQCAEGLFRKRLWGGTFGEVYKRPLCWAEHMSLDNESGLDPPGIRVRPVAGLVAADYFAPGYFVWAVLIANLARIGYEEKTMYMAAYDWRLSFQNTERSSIHLISNWFTFYGGYLLFAFHEVGGGTSSNGWWGDPDWCAKHIKAVMNIGGPFLGVPKALAALFSAEARDIAIARSIAPVVMDKDLFRIQTLPYLMKMLRTWDSTVSMIPKGGETIWGGLDWMIAFGKDAAQKHSSDLKRIDFRGAVKGTNIAHNTCGVWSEYYDMGVGGIKAVEEYKVYTAGDILDLLHFVAPKMIAHGGAHFSYGIAEDLDDPMLPNAPDMEVYSMYGVGIPTERAYVYRQTPIAQCHIPFQIETSADEGNEGCLKNGVFTVDGDETIGAHVDIMGNFALIKDIMRVIAGATGKDLGGDQVHSDIIKCFVMARCLLHGTDMLICIHLEAIQTPPVLLSITTLDEILLCIMESCRNHRFCVIYH